MCCLLPAGCLLAVRMLLRCLRPESWAAPGRLLNVDGHSGMAALQLARHTISKGTDASQPLLYVHCRSCRSQTPLQPS